MFPGNGNGSKRTLSENENPVSKPEERILDVALPDLLCSEKNQSECISIVKNYLHKLLAHSLGRQPSEIDCTTPLLYLGVESLIAMELEHSIASDCQVQVSLKQQLNEISLDQLAEIVALQLIFLRRQTSSGSEGSDSAETLTGWEVKRL
jgi:hypothetical protein